MPGLRVTQKEPRETPTASLHRSIRAAPRGVAPDEVESNSGLTYGAGLPLPVEAYDVISKRQAAHQEQALAEDTIGQEIFRLGAERDQHLDVAWGATRPARSRTLWLNIPERLGDAPARRENEVLAIEPARED